MTSSGAGVRNAVVTLTKPDGETISLRTCTFGFYRFEDLTAGETYINAVISKRFSFVPQIVILSESISDLNFYAPPQ